MVFSDPAAPRIVGAAHVAEEVLEHLPDLARKRHLNERDLAAAFRLLPIAWQDASVYSDRRAEAEQLIAARDPDDWPTVALALELDVPIWSQDKDFVVTGLRLITTGELLDGLRA